MGSALDAKRASLPPTLLEQFAMVQGLMATPDEAVPVFQDLVDAGMRYFILRIWENDLEVLRLFAAHVMPALRTPSAA